MASILDEVDNICDDFVKSHIEKEKEKVFKWLDDMVGWRCANMAHITHMDIPQETYYSRSVPNNYGEHEMYTHVQVIVKEDNLVYIRPLSNFPIQFVGEFNGTLPDYIRFDHHRKVGLHVRGRCKFEGDTWVATSSYTGLLLMCEKV